jgi:hypothetical protein
MSLSKKLTCKMTLRQVFICLMPRTRTPLLTHCIRVYGILNYLFTQGREEGGELNQREGERGNSSQSWVENTNMNDCISSL